MITKQEIVTAVFNAIDLGDIDKYIYPDNFATIPTKTVPICIVQEMRAISNTTTLVGSGYALHNWNVEILIIVARDTAAYPSRQSAANDILANDYEMMLIAELLAAELPDVILTHVINSVVGWFQWESGAGQHDPVWEV